MKKISIQFLVVLCSITLVFSACKKSLLDVEPTIPISTLDDYYQNETEAVKAVNATYTPLSAIYNGSAWHLGDIMSDDADLGGGGGGDGTETAELDNFTVTSFNPIINLMWAQCYFVSLPPGATQSSAAAAVAAIRQGAGSRRRK